MESEVYDTPENIMHGSGSQVGPREPDPTALCPELQEGARHRCMWRGTPGGSCDLPKRPSAWGHWWMGLQGLSVTDRGCEEGDPAALDKGIHSPRILGFLPQHRFSRALGSKHPFQVIGLLTHLTTEGVAGTYEAAGILVCSPGTNQGILAT